MIIYSLMLTLNTKEGCRLVPHHRRHSVVVHLLREPADWLRATTITVWVCIS